MTSCTCGVFKFQKTYILTSIPLVRLFSALLPRQKYMEAKTESWEEEVANIAAHGNRGWAAIMKSRLLCNPCIETHLFIYRHGIHRDLWLTSKNLAKSLSRAITTAHKSPKQVMEGRSLQRWERELCEKREREREREREGEKMEGGEY